MSMSLATATWLETPRGRYVLDWEQPKIATLVADIFGFYALQIGFSDVDLLADSRIPTRLRAGAHLDCDPCFLPFPEQSVDLVVLPHVLEFSSDPHQVLREVERILIPEGQLIVTGFNPVSLWGVSRRLRQLVRSKTRTGYPWKGDYLSVLRVRDWLALLGFVVEGGSFGCFAPPCRQEIWLKRFSFMELAGDRWWGVSGAVYLLRARKRVAGMNLLRPTWHVRHADKKNLAPLVQK